MTRAELQSFERFQADRLFAIARQMTAFGLPGEDPDDPRIKDLMDEAAAASETVEEMISWIAERQTVRR